MTIEIPTTEPLRLVVGDSWAWRREDLTDYPAPTWTLTYRFKNAAGGFEVVATADGANFAIAVAAATTAGYAAGDYAWAARVSNGTTNTTVLEGSTALLPSLFAGSAAAALDLRSDAQKIVAAIDSMLAGRATLDQQEYEISVGGSMRRLRYCTKGELTGLRSYYAVIAQADQARADVANGLKDKRRTYVRFGRV